MWFAVSRTTSDESHAEHRIPAASAPNDKAKLSGPPATTTRRAKP
jgi:hypothetical protein